MAPLPRKAKTKYQIQGLEEKFRTQRYLTKQEQMELAEALGLLERQVSCLLDWLVPLQLIFTKNLLKLDNF